MRLSRGLYVLIGLIWTAGSGALAQEPDASVEWPEDVLGVLEEVDEENATILSAPQRARLDELPLHAQQLFIDAVESGMINNAPQVRTILSLELSSQAMELVLRDNCILCHVDPDMQSEETLFSLDPVAQGSLEHLNVGEFVSDVHFRRGLSCAGCHGGHASDEDMADEIYERWPPSPDRWEDRTWIPEFCGRCHADPGFMRGHNPSLPTDQLAKYRGSRHGVALLQAKDSNAAQCVSCHGNHGIRDARSRRSMTHPQNVPSTCGACHSDPERMAGYALADGSPLPTSQMEEYETSIHGQALLDRGDLGAPACNDCHGNHAAMPPAVATVSQICRTCHPANGALFDGSRHKQVFEQYGWPECGRCHGNHAIMETNDDMLADGPDGMCHACHSQYAQDNLECDASVEYFHASLEEMSRAEENFEAQLEDLAAKGLDVDPLASVLSELHDSARLSRSRIHAFNRSDFDQSADRAHETIEEGQIFVAAAEGEYQFRRRGLLVSVGIMVILAILIYLKLRQIEGRAETRAAEASIPPRGNA